MAVAIADHGIIGDLKTTALVSKNGSIDFFCAPDFDSKPLFADLLGDANESSFSIKPTDEILSVRQIYEANTNILSTTFFCSTGIAEICDFMPLAKKGREQQIIRRIRGVSGAVSLAVSVKIHETAGAPELLSDTELTGADGSGANSSGVRIKLEDGTYVCLLSTKAFSLTGASVQSSFSITSNEHVDLRLVLNKSADHPSDPRSNQALDSIDALYEETSRYWQEWSKKSQYHGRWQSIVQRSALLLKLLSSEEHGGIVSAPTFGLPEEIGGERNWDYRYCWIRDASFTIYAFLRLGYVQEANKFMQWIEARAQRKDFDGSFDPVYRLCSDKPLDEHECKTLQGHKGSRPVRIGNGAKTQKQLDIYGELLDGCYLTNKYGTPISNDSWSRVKKTIDYVTKSWKKTDCGIWEIRGEEKHYLHSRLMCWVAVDRAIRLAQKRSLPAPLHKWQDLRNDIHESIYADFWSEEKKSFVQSKESDQLDGSLLLMPLVKFISFQDPRWLSTFEKIEESLQVDTLIYRYEPGSDGIKGGEGTFTACAFWYVECLARMGKLEQAETHFEKLLWFANHLGLYAEEIAPSGEQLGNFPQALSHLALISAAFALDRELSSDAPRAWSQ